MRFELTVEMDSPAFDDAGELPRILGVIAAKIRKDPAAGEWRAADVSGNPAAWGKYVGVGPKLREKEGKKP